MAPWNYLVYIGSRGGSFFWVCACNLIVQRPYITETDDTDYKVMKSLSRTRENAFFFLTTMQFHCTSVRLSNRYSEWVLYLWTDLFCFFLNWERGEEKEQSICSLSCVSVCSSSSPPGLLSEKRMRKRRNWKTLGAPWKVSVTSQWKHRQHVFNF